MRKKRAEDLPRAEADQRRYLRAPLMVLKVSMDDGCTRFFGYAKNISSSGMFIPATKPQEVGSRFRVELPLPSPINKTVQCTCEVIWARPYKAKQEHPPGMGLKFIDLPDEVAEQIRAWVESGNQRLA